MKFPENNKKKSHPPHPLPDLSGEEFGVGSKWDWGTHEVNLPSPGWGKGRG